MNSPLIILELVNFPYDKIQSKYPFGINKHLNFFVEGRQDGNFCDIIKEPARKQTLAVQEFREKILHTYAVFHRKHVFLSIFICFRVNRPVSWVNSSWDNPC